MQKIRNITAAFLLAFFALLQADNANASRRYTWGTGGRLLMATDEMTDTYTRYAYDEFDNLIRADVSGIERQLETIYRAPDAIGNLYETKEKTDRQYDRGSRLIQDKNYFYHHDCEGNLIFKEYKTLQRSCNPPMPAVRKSLEKDLGIAFKATATGWRYDWTAGGMLAKVTRPDGETVEFAYDALGRRTKKIYKGCATHFVWDGNTPLHEWTSKENVTTWLFEQDTFIPAAKLAANGENFSIVSDYMGTPMMALNSNGKKVWSQTLDIFGRNTEKCTNFVPFRYQGQYYDEDIDLCYNYYRWYDQNVGNYISQDPLRLTSENSTLYAYVDNPNEYVDVFGLTMSARSKSLPKNLRRRPKWNKSTLEKLEEIEKGNMRGGKYIDRKKGTKIEGDKVIGHQNQSWYEYQEAHKNDIPPITREQVIADYNNVDNLGYEDAKKSSSDGGKYRGHEH